MTPEEALIRVGESTGAAVAGALEAYCPGAVSTGAPVMLADDADPVEGVALPAVVADVSYIDGVTGGNLFLMPLAAARALATAMMGVDPASPDAEAEIELTELELSAAGEVANQMMAAAAAATSAVLGQEVAIAAPETRVIATAAEALARKESATSIVSVSIELLGHQCRLIQLVPHAFVVRMTRALDELDAEFHPTAAGAALGDGTGEIGTLPADLLGSVGLRIAAELGRVSMTIRRAVALAPGAVVAHDTPREGPRAVYVN
jgi:flagellar motor switch protein FliN/FliY